jgi:hypothetical protein
MGKHVLDFKVHVAGDYVYLSTEDWLQIVKVLNHLSSRSTIRETDNNEAGLGSSRKLH